MIRADILWHCFCGWCYENLCLLLQPILLQNENAKYDAYLFTFSFTFSFISFSLPFILSISLSYYFIVLPLLLLLPFIVFVPLSLPFGCSVGISMVWMRVLMGSASSSRTHRTVAWREASSTTQRLSIARSEDSSLSDSLSL